MASNIFGQVTEIKKNQIKHIPSALSTYASKSSNKNLLAGISNNVFNSGAMIVFDCSMKIFGPSGDKNLLQFSFKYSFTKVSEKKRSLSFGSLRYKVSLSKDGS